MEFFSNISSSNITIVIISLIVFFHEIYCNSSSRHTSRKKKQPMYIKAHHGRCSGAGDHARQCYETVHIQRHLANEPMDISRQDITACAQKRAAGHGRTPRAAAPAHTGETMPALARGTVHKAVSFRRSTRSLPTQNGTLS